MKKKRPSAARIVPWLIASAALASLIIFVGIPLYSESASESDRPPRIIRNGIEQASYTLENDRLLFDMDASTTSFVLTDKRTGETWRSNPENWASDPIALSTNKDSLAATLILTYGAENGASVDMNNYTYSIQNGLFEIMKTEDGEIRVDYTIGKIARAYLVPNAITQERMEQFLDGLSKGSRAKIVDSYKLYTKEALAAADNREELTERFPEAVNTPLYILRDGMNEKGLKKLEEYLAKTGYTQEDYALDQMLMVSAKEEKQAAFNISMIYRLDGGDLVVDIPYDSIAYWNEYPVTSVTPLPFLGAVGANESGAMFVPEGGGALIQCNSGKLVQSAYYANFYGWDYAMLRDLATGETRADFAAFGMLRENSSLLCIVESGAALGGVQADIGGRKNSYNAVQSKFSVLHTDAFNVSNRTNDYVYMFEDAIPEETITLRYRPVAGGGYVQMANAYGDYLYGRADTSAQSEASRETPVLIEWIGAIDKTVVRGGVPMDAVIPATTFSQAKTLLESFTEAGVVRLNARLAGWCNGGIRQQVLTKIDVPDELGGAKALASLTEWAKRSGVQMYLDGVTSFAYDSGLAEGFLSFRDAARYVTQEQAKLYPYSKIWYAQEALESYYLTTPAYAAACADRLIAYAMEAGVGVALRDTGSILSADYNRKGRVSREQSLRAQEETLASAQSNAQGVLINRGNDYALPYADLIADMQLRGTEYALIDLHVPFYQIALHGRQDYVCEPINLAGDWQAAVLEAAEYGAGLQFTLMAEDAKLLQDSVYTGYFGAGFDAWGERAKQIILDYQADMRGLNNQRMVDHQVLSDDVRVTVYEDGTTVYVNYGDDSYAMDGAALAPHSYYVARKGEAQ